MFGLKALLITALCGMLTLTCGFAVQAWIDNFEDGKLDGWTQGPQRKGGWEIKDGELHYDGGGDSVLYAGDVGWTDYELEVDIKLTVKQDYPGGIRVRVNPKDGTNYFTWVYPGKQEIMFYVGTGWNCNSNKGVADQKPWKVPPLNEFHKLKIVAKGSDFEVYWDGKKHISYTDNSYKKGCIALNGYNKPVVFDNVRVSGKGIPLSPGEAVNLKGKVVTTWSKIKNSY